MNNKDKQYLADIEARLIRVERILEAISQSTHEGLGGYSCNQCGAPDPGVRGVVCSIPDCCQGLNPEDDD